MIYLYKIDTSFSPGWKQLYLYKIDNLIFTRVKMHLSIKSLEKMRTFKAFFGIEGPLQTCGPELKTKLHDPFEPFSASYHVLLVNRVSEVIFINSFISDAQISTTFHNNFIFNGFILAGINVESLHNYSKRPPAKKLRK